MRRSKIRDYKAFHKKTTEDREEVVGVGLY